MCCACVDSHNFPSSVHFHFHCRDRATAKWLRTLTSFKPTELPAHLCCCGLSDLEPVANLFVACFPQLRSGGQGVPPWTLVKHGKETGALSTSHLGLALVTINYLGDRLTLVFKCQLLCSPCLHFLCFYSSYYFWLRHFS